MLSLKGLLMSFKSLFTLNFSLSEVYAEGLHEAAFSQQYVRSVEWAVSRLPASSLRASMELRTTAERWLAILATFTALVVSSLFVSVLTWLRFHLDYLRLKSLHVFTQVT